MFIKIYFNNLYKTKIQFREQQKYTYIMIPILCLVTLTTFSTYWLVISVYKKAYHALQKTSTPTSVQQNEQQLKQIDQHEQQTKYESQMNKIGAITAEYDQKSKTTQDQNNMLQQQQGQKLDANRLQIRSNLPQTNLANKHNISQNQIASSSNILNIAMIDQKLNKQFKNEMINQHQQNISQNEHQNSGILNQIINQDQELQQKQHQQNQLEQQIIPRILVKTVDSDNQDEAENRQKSQNKQIYRQINSPLNYEFEHHKNSKFAEQKSQLQILQAFNIPSNRHAQNQHINSRQNGKNEELQLVKQTQLTNNDLGNILYRKFSESDPVIVKLTQQIDQLFLNAPEKFASIMNKYKVQETRYNGNRDMILDAKSNNTQNYQKQQENNQSDDRIKKLQSQLEILQIAVSEYKSANDTKDNQIQQYKKQVNYLKNKLQKLNRQFQQKIKLNTQNSLKLQKLTQQNRLISSQNEQIKLKATTLNKIVHENQQKIIELHNFALMKQKQTQNMQEKINKLGIQLQSAKNDKQQLLRELQAIKNKSTQIMNKNDNIQIQQNSKDPLNNKNENGGMQQNVAELLKSNQNLKNQIQFAQTQIRMFEQTEASHLKTIKQLEQQIHFGKNSEAVQLRAKISRMQPIVNQYETMQKRYFQMKLKYEKLLHEKNDKQKLNNSSSRKKQVVSAIFQGSDEKQYKSNIIMASSPKANKISTFGVNSPEQKLNQQNQGSNQGLVPIGGNYKFLVDCGFVNMKDRQFLYQTLKNLIKGVLKTQKLYNSKSNRSKNPHELIDNIRGILLLVHLQNNKILGAYTHEPFTQVHPHSVQENIGFIFDVTNHRYFVNQSGINSIGYNSGSIVWGFNQILLKIEESQVLYTNFCRNHNLYWDGKYKIQQFIGCDKQWARIWQYQIFRVSKL